MSKCISKGLLSKRINYNDGFHAARYGKRLVAAGERANDAYYLLGFLAGEDENVKGLPHGTSAAAWNRSQVRLKEAA